MTRVYSVLHHFLAHCRPPQSKLLREDAVHNMYVSGATEVEVKSVAYSGLHTEQLLVCCYAVRGHYLLFSCISLFYVCDINYVYAG